MTRVVLPLAAVIVLGLGVYLFVAVRAQPVEPVTVAARPAPAPAPPLEAPPPEPASAPVVVHDAAPPPPRDLPPSLGTPSELPDAKGDALMAEANKAYDRGDFEDAKIIAGRLLREQPANVRMLRIMVSASCQDGDVAVAQAHYAKLPPSDQAQMRTRCARYGVQFSDGRGLPPPEGQRGSIDRP